MNLEDKVDNERIGRNHLAVHPTTTGRAAAANHYDATPDVHVRDDDSMSHEASRASRSFTPAFVSRRASRASQPLRRLFSAAPPQFKKRHCHSMSDETAIVSPAREEEMDGVGRAVNEFLTAYRRYLKTQVAWPSLERGRRGPDDVTTPSFPKNKKLSTTLQGGKSSYRPSHTLGDDFSLLSPTLRKL